MTITAVELDRVRLPLDPPFHAALSSAVRAAVGDSMDIMVDLSQS